MLKGVILWRDGDEIKGWGPFIGDTVDAVLQITRRRTLSLARRRVLGINWDKGILGIRDRQNNLTWRFTWFKNRWVEVETMDARRVLHQDVGWCDLLDPVTAQPV